MDTTVTFRTDKQLKEEASKIYEAMGINLTTALNMFMRQTVAKKRFPLSLDVDIVQDNAFNYNSDFFSLFGQGNNLGFDDEPEEIPFDNEDIVL